MRISHYFSRWIHPNRPRKSSSLCKQVSSTGDTFVKDRRCLRPESAVISKNLAPRAESTAANNAPSFSLAEAKQFIKCAEYRKAQEILSNIIEETPNDAEARALRGATRRMLDEIGPAYSDFNDALRINPGNRTAILNRAALAFFTVGVSKARADIDQFLIDNPDDHFALLCKGVLGHSNAAIGALRYAIQLNPHNIAALETLCTRMRMHIESGSTEACREAAWVAEKTLAIDSDNKAAKHLKASLASPDMGAPWQLTAESLLGFALSMPLAKQDPSFQ